jgi:hypothetical protein
VARALGLVVVIALCAACAPAAAPAPTATPISATGFPLSDPEAFCPPPPAWVAHRVRPGDTLPELAAATNATVELLLAANCLSRVGPLDTGSIVFLPRAPR